MLPQHGDFMRSMLTHFQPTTLHFLPYFLSLALQFVFCAVSLFKGPHKVKDIPWWLFVISFLWPIVFMPIQEVVKARDLKECIRAQKLAKLEFNTKLGMHSPL